MEQTVKEIIDKMDKARWGGTSEDERRRADRRSAKEQIAQLESRDMFIPVQRMKCVRDSTITVRSPRPLITSPEIAKTILRAYFKDMDREIVVVMPMDAQLRYLSVTTVAIGTIDHVVVHPSEVFKVVLAKDNAASFIVAHNHPSGKAEMSDDDKLMFDDLQRLGLALERPMKDFVIIGDGTGDYYSHVQAQATYGG